MSMIAASHVIQIDATTLAMLSGLLVPLLVGLVTKAHASAGVKAAVNAFLSAVGGALATAVQAKGSVDWTVTAVNIGLTWAISIASYYGLWKPAGVAPKIQALLPKFGVGREEPEVPVAA